MNYLMLNNHIRQSGKTLAGSYLFYNFVLRDRLYLPNQNDNTYFGQKDFEIIAIYW